MKQVILDTNAIRYFYQIECCNGEGVRDKVMRQYYFDQHKYIQFLRTVSSINIQMCIRDSYIVFNADKAYSRFKCVICMREGYRDESIVQIEINDEVIYTSEKITCQTEPFTAVSYTHLLLSLPYGNKWNKTTYYFNCQQCQIVVRGYVCEK